MWLTARAFLTSLLAIGGALALAPASARAQMGGMAGGGRSLGGYGAGTITSYYGGGGGGYVPYNGNASGFVPYQGGYGGGMGVQPVPRRLPETPIGGVMMAETPIGGASLAAETMRRALRGGRGMDSRAGSRTFAPFGYQGAMAGADGGMLPMTSRAGARRTPSGPGFGYPFRMPPGLTGGTAGGMAMP